MSRDVSPEVCGWCGVEMPCGCDDDMSRFAEIELIAALRSDIAAAREAIRILLGEAGLAGLVDLTTVDGRSVVDIVRRGMGVG